MLIRSLVVASFATGLPGCGGCGDSGGEAGEPLGRPNVLLISIDTLRADHMSAYGYKRATTPELAALALGGVRFAAAYAPSATTAPSHASLFTSLYPPTHRVIKNGRVLHDEHETLAEVLSRWGYRCGAVVSSYVLNRKFGFHQGFDHWDDDFSLADVPIGERAVDGVRTEGKYYGQADDTTRRALAWLERQPGQEPFFLFVHYYDPHYPYDPPAAFARRFQPGPDSPGPDSGPDSPRARSGLDRTIEAYDGEIAYADHQIGRLLGALDSLGLAEETLVVATADHGEGLMQHGHMHHGVHIYEEAVHVPLILRWPARIAPGAVISTPVELTDVAPTILELVRTAGEWPGDPSGEAAHSVAIDALLRAKAGRRREPEAERGHSLVSLLAGGSDSAHDAIFFYRRHYDGSKVAREWVEGERFGVRQGRWKYLRGEGPVAEELYDLEQDPNERENLFSLRPEIAGRLSQRLEQWYRSVVREDREIASMSEQQAEERARDRERLKALGYVD